MDRQILKPDDIRDLLVEKFNVTIETAAKYAQLLVNYRQYSDNIRYTDEVSLSEWK